MSLCLSLIKKINLHFIRNENCEMVLFARSFYQRNMKYVALQLDATMRDALRRLDPMEIIFNSWKNRSLKHNALRAGNSLARALRVCHPLSSRKGR